MQTALERKLIALTEYQIRRIMRENGMYPATQKKYNPHGRSKGKDTYLPDQVKQEFCADKPNSIWVGDITYIKTLLGWVYLAIVLDLFNREIIGYSVSKKCDTELVKRALANALARTNGGEEATKFHSDRGTQYASKSFQAMLEKHGLIGSMSRPGNPFDNACAESFFSTAKRECMYRREYVDIDAVQTDLFEYIELFYNRKRLHATLGNLSPVEYRRLNAA
jgi:transposase InsO family protein